MLLPEAMAPNCTVKDEFTAPSICCAGGKGTILGADRPIPSDWSTGTTGLIYLLLLLWSFVGVAIVSDCFMAAIETITSQTYTIKQDAGGVTRRFRVRVWNSTVANLTLMALGSSAPEILLSVIELLSNNCFSGELGPSTIVGSAAFNLLIIIAVPRKPNAHEHTTKHVCHACACAFSLTLQPTTSRAPSSAPGLRHGDPRARWPQDRRHAGPRRHRNLLDSGVPL